MKIEIFTRRQFIQRMGRMGFYGAATLGLLNCTGSVPTLDDIDPPFICDPLDNCNSGLGGSFDNTTGGNPVFLVFSAYNKSTEKVTGYNIWYNITPSTIVSQHAVKDRSSVIIQNNTTTVDASAVGGAIPTIPSTLVLGAFTQTTFIGITVNNTPTPGAGIYVTAYNGTDGEDSNLSNLYTVL